MAAIQVHAAVLLCTIEFCGILWSIFGQTHELETFERPNRSFFINEHAEVELMLAMDKLIPIEGVSDSESKHRC